MDVINIIKGLPRQLSAYGFSMPLERALREYLDFLVDREDLLARAQYLHDEIFEKDPRNLTKFRTLEENDGRETGMLFAVMFLARYEGMDAILAERGIPVTYKKASLFVYQENMRKSKERYGVYGLQGMYKSGMVAFLTPWKFILGRLTFEMDWFGGPYAVYRNRENGTLTLMAVPGYFYGEDGRRLPQDFDGTSFEPCLQEDGKMIRGFVFAEDGNLNMTEVALDAGRYECILKPGDTSMSVHIPEMGKLCPELVDEAFSLAEDFFGKYYQQWNYPAYVCSSWLLNKDLSQLLPYESNIMRFQSRFRIAMSSVNNYSIYWHVFGVQNFVPLSELVPKNGFQQRMLDWVLLGNTLYNGNGFILRHPYMCRFDRITET